MARERFTTDYNDTSETPRIYKVFGVNSFTELVQVIGEYREELIAQGVDPTAIPETFTNEATIQNRLGFSGEKQDWRLLIYLKDGRTEEVIVRARMPRAAINRVKRANTLDAARRKRWNNNVESATLEPINGSSDVIELDKTVFDRETDFSSLGASWLENEFPSRYDPYATRDGGRLDTLSEKILHTDEEGNDVQNVETIYNDTEPTPATSSDTLAVDAEDINLPTTDQVSLEDFKALSDELYGIE